jgi:hypothetical protein
MIKQYYYAIDDFNRFTEIYEITDDNKEELSYYLFGEFEEAEVKNIVFNKTGLVNGKIKVVGQTTKEKEEEQLLQLQSELFDIQQWLTQNDWVPNKIVTGEWENTDARWLAYLEQRQLKRTRQDEILELLGE